MAAVYQSPRRGARAKAVAMTAACQFNVEALGHGVSKIVQDDRYTQYPFLYTVEGVDKMVVIDTGCPVAPGGVTYKEFLDKNVNTRGLRYVVVCTHVHFDHVGGNCEFCNQLEGGAFDSDKQKADICMSGRNKTFTNNYALNSLASAHNAVVGDFTVTRWLEEGDVVRLDDASADPNDALEVLYTPGHTPDSISLYYPRAQRVFTGDLVYPFTTVHLDSLGSNVDEYMASLSKLLARFGGDAHAGSRDEARDTALPTPCMQVLDLLGLTPDAVARQFCVRTLLALCEDNAEQAANMYLTNLDEIGALCPPGSFEESAHEEGGGGSAAATVTLSCGHVEANLNIAALAQVRTLVQAARAGGLPPAAVDDGYGEYTDGTYSIMMPLQVR